MIREDGKVMIDRRHGNCFNQYGPWGPLSVWAKMRAITHFMNDRFIFKLLTQDQWQSFQGEKTFKGAPIDLADGYIHFSTRMQVAETAQKYFSDEPVVVLAEIAVEALPEPVKWEPARQGALFPHLYADLPLESVERHSILKRDADGTFQIPAWGRPN